ncbi:MAG: zinc ribbon domain-containing protein [Pyrinomonadaceae bacterium]
MSLIYCPECGHEISNNAVACPNCGRPISEPVPVVEKKVVVMKQERRESEFPTWAFIPIGLLAVLLLVVVYFAFRTDDATQTNINVTARRGATDPVRDSRTTSVPPSDSQSVTIPPSGEQSVTLPPGQTTTVPGTTTSAPVAPPPDKGTAVINARVAPARGGAPQTVRNAKFHLLDEDLETILSEAQIEPIEGNTLTGSLGLAIVYPDRYGDFQRKAMRAIAAHSKYSGTTDGGGNANLSNIAPKEYYLFGITKVGRGFALWNAPVSIIAGQNNLNLSPQSVTEIPEATG